MTKSTITREESVQAVFNLKVGYRLEFADLEILKRVARMALAAMDSEPVALKPELAKVIYHFRDWNEGFPVERFKADCVISWMLANYPPAQPAPVVPQDVLEALQKVARIRLDMNDFDGDRRGIADCLGDAEEALIEVVNRRAAMLHASPVCTCPSGDGSLRWPCPVHPGSSPAIPDGYVMVPKEPTAQMYHAGDRQMTTKQVWDAMLAAAPQGVIHG
ncbi:hypothetical protein ACKLKE_23140 [Klebsiella quasipneumoniae subsp. similipneumoniae]|uniref:hypothetical protein n=1 Tax=Klebsiella quasipneumoniae TaxID=1463165 RepID=UPI003B283509